MDLKKFRLAYSILAVLFGIFMFVYGEFDDSPGGQLLGLLMFIGGIVGIVKSKKKIIKPDSGVSGMK